MSLILPRYLFRGVNLDMHAKNEGLIVPKGDAWAWRTFHGGSAHYGDGSTHGRSAANAIVRHQEDSSRFRTAWISFTPHEAIATGYALFGGRPEGIVYVVDTERLAAHCVVASQVGDVATWPTKPDDEEVVLRAQTGGALPREIVVGARTVRRL